MNLEVPDLLASSVLCFLSWICCSLDWSCISGPLLYVEYLVRKGELGFGSAGGSVLPNQFCYWGINLKNMTLWILEGNPLEEGLIEMAPNRKSLVLSDTQTFTFFCVLWAKELQFCFFFFIFISSQTCGTSECLMGKSILLSVILSCFFKVIRLP